MFTLNQKAFDVKKEGGKYIIITDIEFNKANGFEVHVDASNQVVGVYRKTGF